MGYDCIPALKALSEEKRLRMVSRLMTRDYGVNQMAVAMHTLPCNISKHLRILRDAGLVEVEKHGQHRTYRLARGIRAQIEPGTRRIDLGCCQFDLDKLTIRQKAK